ncbi:HD domain-containing protein [Crocinitomix algicola]|uniref:HD domain-containing protein n=1 Tax=Crocinitomix algicola TaxID=1740263 RepID=UPI000872AFC4|nr:HD domain-containing protein [Crocinitomix algicola]
MQKQEIIQAVANHFKEEFAHESTGHDWFHIERVWKNAKLINKDENADSFIVELAALMHDIADHKFVEDADEVAKKRTVSLLANLGVEQNIIDQVVHIVLNSSFKGGVGANKMKLKEGLIVQDADRLDAIGAIGIARTFAFGGKFGSQIYNPEIEPMTFKNAEEYRKNRSHTINHFYEKLLLLKDGMNTATGRKLAEDRHKYMEEFLHQFYAEWEGEK